MMLEPLGRIGWLSFLTSRFCSSLDRFVQCERLDQSLRRSGCRKAAVRGGRRETFRRASPCAARRCPGCAAPRSAAADTHGAPLRAGRARLTPRPPRGGSSSAPRPEQHRRHLQRRCASPSTPCAGLPRNVRSEASPVQLFLLSAFCWCSFVGTLPPYGFPTRPRSGFSVWQNLGLRSEGIGVEECSLEDYRGEEWSIGMASQNGMVVVLFEELVGW
eukprot:COSAG03_NODE_6684_length_1020_cov_1.147666_1_plen_217_part_00